MISRTTQTWTPGARVKVGFMPLIVLECISTPGNYRPDGYVLTDTIYHATFYSFVPHHGVRRHDTIEQARAEVTA